MRFPTEPPRLAESFPGATVNGLVNGAITWSAFKDMAQVPLSVDSIATTDVTALGNAALVAFALTFIMTSVTFFRFRAAARKADDAPDALKGLPYLGKGLGMALRNTLLVFGGFVAAAVLWQRLAGTRLVGPLSATLVVAMVALVATAIADWRTRREMLSTSMPLRRPSLQSRSPDVPRGQHGGEATNVRRR